MRYLADFKIGDQLALPQLEVSLEEMVAFAKAYDPQPIHIDPSNVEARALGGVIASGWFTTALLMKMSVLGYLSETAVLTSPGVDNLRWLSPVKPGSLLSGEETVTAVRQSQTKPDRGVVTCDVRLWDDSGKDVLTLTKHFFVRVDEAG